MSVVNLPTRPTISNIHTLYRDEGVSVVAVVDYFFEKIESYDNLIKSLLRVTKDRALKKARELDLILENAKAENLKIVDSVSIVDPFGSVISASDPFWFDDLISKYPLFGIPFVTKDNILVEGEITTSASKILEGFVAPFSSNVFTSMDQAGAVLLGQSNMDEFAFGSSTEKSAYQITHNPVDTDRVPGGTSGGSAAAVAIGLVPVALGSDTGGSIRQPSSFCGTVGVRPTYGLVSRYGVMPSTSSFDQVGPITNSVLDNALVLSVLEGKNPNDQTSLNTSKSRLNNFLNHPEFGGKINTHRLLQILLDAIEAFGNVHGVDSGDEVFGQAQGYLADTYSKKPILGIPKEYFAEGLSLETKEKLEEVITQLENTFEIKEVDLPLTKYSLSVYYILQFVESTANLERYDGIRYGAQIPNRTELFFQERSELLGPEVKRRIMLGTYTSSAGYYDAYYNKACQVRELIRQDFLKAFEQVDLLFMPTSPFPAFKIGSKDGDPLSMYLADIMTISQPPSRLPCLVIPVGLVDYEGSKLPVGAQLVGPELSEDLLYRVGYQIEKMLASTESN
jgi:aspartyl-tRNA(Asn)/glutamyl-tRNA(Gln) amidotransferase subunit A